METSSSIYIFILKIHLLSKFYSSFQCDNSTCTFWTTVQWAGYYAPIDRIKSDINTTHILVLHLFLD